MSEVLPVQIFGNADIALALGVTNAAVSNWLTRHSDTVPTAFAVAVDGRKYWNLDGLREWRKWYQKLRSKDATAGATGAEARRAQAMAKVIAQLESE